MHSLRTFTHLAVKVLFNAELGCLRTLTWRCGGIGRRNGLKIRRLTPCRFDSGHRHHSHFQEHPETSDVFRNLRWRYILPNGSVERQKTEAARVDTLQAIYNEWVNTQRTRLAQSTQIRDRGRLASYVFPSLRSRPIAGITAAELLACLRKTEAKGIHESALRTRSLVGRVMHYAIATGRVERDMTQDLRGALTTPKTKSFCRHRRTRRIGELRAIND